MAYYKKLTMDWIVNSSAMRFMIFSIANKHYFTSDGITGHENKYLGYFCLINPLSETVSI